jgi:hypothetical protein
MALAFGALTGLGKGAFVPGEAAEGLTSLTQGNWDSSIFGFVWEPASPASLPEIA